MTYRIMDEKGSKVQDWAGFEYTGELMHVQFENGANEVLRVIKGSFTPYGAIRDCGDHYIKANHSSYTRIDKGTMKVTKDVEDC